MQYIQRIWILISFKLPIRFLFSENDLVCIILIIGVACLCIRPLTKQFLLFLVLSTKSHLCVCRFWNGFTSQFQEVSSYDVNDLLIRQTKTSYMSQFCLCWRCTQSGTSSDPDVVLLRWAFWVQGDLILIYYWGRLRSAAPMGGSPCSAVLRHLRVVNALVHVQLNDWAGKQLLALTA